MQVDRRSSSYTIPVYVPSKKDGGLINPYNLMSPPFFETWKNPVGMGVKRKEKHKGRVEEKDY